MNSIEFTARCILLRTAVLICGMVSLSSGAIPITTSNAPFAGSDWRWSMDFPPIEFTITAAASGPYLFVIQNAYGASVPLQSIATDQGGAAIWSISGDSQFQYVFTWLQGAANQDVTSRDATLFANDNNPNLNIGDVVLFARDNDPFTLYAGGNTMWGIRPSQPTLFQSGTYEMFMADGNGNRISTDAVIIPEPGVMSLIGIGAISLLAVRRACRTAIYRATAKFEQPTAGRSAPSGG
jgi:hypothetical protein